MIQSAHNTLVGLTPTKEVDHAWTQEKDFQGQELFKSKQQQVIENSLVRGIKPQKNGLVRYKPFFIVYFWYFTCGRI